MDGGDRNSVFSLLQRQFNRMLFKNHTEREARQFHQISETFILFPVIVFGQISRTFSRFNIRGKLTCQRKKAEVKIFRSGMGCFIKMFEFRFGFIQTLK